jgi:hypothetical protein
LRCTAPDAACVCCWRAWWSWSRRAWISLEWTLSRLVIEPVTERIARHAAALLADAGLHGHKHAIDAMLSATALAAPGPVSILTSDPENLTVLCRGQATVIKL